MKKPVAILAVLAVLLTLLPGCTNSPQRQLKKMGYEMSPQAFLQSVEKGDTNAVTLFLAAEMPPDARNEEGLTALMIAVEAGHFDMATVLVGNKADVNAASLKDSWTPLHLAASRGHSEVIALLLGKGASVDALTQSGETPLMLAAEASNIEAVKALVEGKADVNAAREHDGYTALHLVAAKRVPTTLDVLKKEIYKTVLDAGASPNLGSRDGTTPLMTAVDNNEYELAKLLLERGAHINSQNQHGETALMMAAGRHLEEVTRLLLEYGADISIESLDGLTALDYSHTESDTVVGVLLEGLGAPMGSKRQRMEALRMAVKSGDLEKSREYIRQGVDPDSLWYYDTALCLAAKNNDCEMALMLLDEGSFIDGHRYVDFTPLMTAAYEGHLDMVRLLLDKGANINRTTANWGSALSLAESRGYREVVELLKAAGAK